VMASDFDPINIDYNGVAAGNGRHRQCFRRERKLAS
jgi:hypothetical protein